MSTAQKDNVMIEKAKGWLDIGYKGAVMLGLFAAFWVRSNFASKEDIIRVGSSIHAIEIQLAKIEQALLTQAIERGHLAEEIKGLRDYQRDIDVRLRSVEKRQ